MSRKIKPDYEGQMYKVDFGGKDSVYEGKPAVTYFDVNGEVALRTRASNDDVRSWAILKAIEKLAPKITSSEEKIVIPEPYRPHY
jgi:hypothetical protein